MRTSAPYKLTSKDQGGNRRIAFTSTYQEAKDTCSIWIKSNHTNITFTYWHAEKKQYVKR